MAIMSRFQRPGCPTHARRHLPDTVRDLRSAEQQAARDARDNGRSIIGTLRPLPDRRGCLVTGAGLCPSHFMDIT